MTLSEKPEPFVTEQRPEMFSKSPLLNRTLAGVLLPFLFLVGFTLYQASGLFSRLEEQVRSELAITLDHVAHDLA